MSPNYQQAHETTHWTLPKSCESLKYYQGHRTTSENVHKYSESFIKCTTWTWHLERKPWLTYFQQQPQIPLDSPNTDRTLHRWENALLGLRKCLMPFLPHTGTPSQGPSQHSYSPPTPRHLHPRPTLPQMERSTFRPGTRCRMWGWGGCMVGWKSGWL